MATLTEVKNGVRIEKDFLGEKEVPNYAYYGVQTMRAVENFPITGYKIHEGLIRAFAIVKKAAALANTDVGRLELNKGGAIAEAAQEILDGKSTILGNNFAFYSNNCFLSMIKYK